MLLYPNASVVLLVAITQLQNQLDWETDLALNKFWVKECFRFQLNHLVQLVGDHRTAHLDGKKATRVYGKDRTVQQ